MEFPSSFLILRHCLLVLLVPSCSVIIPRNHSGSLTVLGDVMCTASHYSPPQCLSWRLLWSCFHKFITLPPLLRWSSQSLVCNVSFPHHYHFSPAPPSIAVPRAHCPFWHQFLFHLPMICLSFFFFLGWSSGIFLECGRIHYVRGDPVPSPLDWCKFLLNSFLSFSSFIDSPLPGSHSCPCSFGWRGGIPSLRSTPHLLP